MKGLGLELSPAILREPDDTRDGAVHDPRRDEAQGRRRSDPRDQPDREDLPHRCAIFQAVGACIMPKRGRFRRVICGGKIVEGTELKL